MREWLKTLSEIDLDCVQRYEYLLGRQLTGPEEYTEIDRQVNEMILEWEDRTEFFAEYPMLQTYRNQQPEKSPALATAGSKGMYDGMLPAAPKAGYRGFYPVTSREEWDALPDLYKAMEWDPVPDIHDKSRLRAVKAVIFDVVHLEPYQIRAKVSVHPSDVQKLLFCHFGKTDCHLYSVCGVELEGGSRLHAKWLQDSVTGAFGIFVGSTCVGRQGGFRGFIPEHVQRLSDGTFRFDFRQGSGKTVHFELHNPFPKPENQYTLNDRIHHAESQLSAPKAPSDPPDKTPEHPR